MRTLDLLAVEPGMVNGETESSTAGLKIRTEEMQCQVFISVFNQCMAKFWKILHKIILVFLIRVYFCPCSFDFTSDVIKTLHCI